ncbi:MAG: hypothetical protein AAFY71_06465 [Bacteroidota bacterium]
MFSTLSKFFRWFILLLIIILVSCRSTRKASSSFAGLERVFKVTPYPQDSTGDPEAGFRYMTTGGMVGNGIPWEVNKKFFGTAPDTITYREGLNASLPYTSTAFEVEPGQVVVNGNCFTCHSQRLNGKVVLGLGNSFSDYTRSMKRMMQGFNFLVKNKYGKNSREWEIYEEQGKWFEAIAAATVMPNPGLNPAFRLEEATAAYRNPNDLTFRKDPSFKLDKPSIGTDVPALWHLQKKEALYYTGVGRGDYTKLLMQVTMLGMHDSTQARQIQRNFKDVIAWINQIEPPAYPWDIDQKLALEGQEVFLTNCSKCHGTYEADHESYPNRIIPISKIQTDDAYALYNMNTPLFDWFNRSWFKNSGPQTDGKPSYGYMAPPLDGIWATAPYLHNGSVPTLYALLDSKKRPAYWERSGDSHDYDPENVGWNYTERNNGKGEWTYDTTQPGSGNMGHYFGDRLSERERKAVLEYLKTL